MLAWLKSVARLGSACRLPEGMKSKGGVSLCNASAMSSATSESGGAR